MNRSVNRFSLARAFFATPNTLIINRLLTLFIAAELLFFIRFRKINLDEGWYLWASKLVYEGQLLYRDFTYTQTPLLPYVYGLWQQVAGESLMAGRVLTGLFSLSTAIVGSWIVERRIRQRGIAHNGIGIITHLLLFSTSLFAFVYLSYTATYGLATFLILAALYFALDQDSHTSFRGDLLTSALLCLAVATRLSILPALPVLLVFRIWRSSHKLKTILGIGLVLGISAILVGALALASGSQMVYDIFGFHTDRTPSMLRQFWRMVETTKNTGFAYGVPLFLILAGSVWALVGTVRKRHSILQLLQRNDYEIALLLSSLGIFLLHLWPRTTDAYYNTLLFPIWIILAALVVAKISAANMPPSRSQSTAWKGWAAALGSGLILINLLLQTVAARQNDLLQIPPINQLKTVDDAAQFLARIDKNDNQLLTLNTHLALESGMVVPRGYEMSIFSYRPDWTNEQAAQFQVINNQGLIKDLAAGVDAVAVTDFDLERFYGARQQIFDTLNSHYRLAKTVPAFDPFYNNLYIYLPPQFTELSPHVPLLVDLENGISMLGHDLTEDLYRPGDEVIAAVYWRAEEVPELSYTVFMHLYDETGHVLDGWDNPPCRTTCPTTSWQAGEILRDEYTLRIPEDAAPGTYGLRVGMYHSDTGNNVMAVSQEDLIRDGIIQDGRLMVLGEIEVLSP